MHPSEEAQVFHKDGYNCAQAVLTALVGPAEVDRARLATFAGYGSGNAPGGECGALFAAKALLADADARQRVEEAFLETASSTKCRDIRARRTIACRRCVQTAAEAALAEAAAGASGWCGY